MKLTLQAVQIASRHDTDGRLVFADDQLVAVLVRLSEMHGDSAGDWFLEVCFEALDHPPHCRFKDLDTALDWIAERLAEHSDLDGGEQA